MNAIAKTSLLLAAGTFFGAFVWLWMQHGSAVFVTYAEAFLAWCF